jgi:hypothetical protein
LENQTFNYPLYPRAYDGWALTASIFLDRACPGFLADTLCANNLARQVRFATLAAMDMNSPEVLAERLHKAANNQNLSLGRDPLVEIARALLILRPCVVLEAVYGSCPNGLLGLLARLDASPVDRDLYRAVHTIFSNPAHRPRAEILLQTHGPITGTKLSILNRLDPLLVHKGVVDRVYGDGVQIGGLHAFLSLIRTLCDATDEEITRSIDKLAPRTKLTTWAVQWLRRQVRLAVQPPIPADDRRFQVLFGEALYECASEFRNCLKGYLANPALGKVLYFRWTGTTPAVLELETHSEGRWVLGDMLGPRNTLIDAETKAHIRAALTEHDVLYARGPTMPRPAAAGLSYLLELWGVPREEATTDIQDDMGYVVANLGVLADQGVLDGHASH